MRTWSGRAANSAIQLKRSHADRHDRPDEAGPRADRSPARQGQSLVPFSGSGHTPPGLPAAGIRLAGETLSGICRLDLYGAWRLLTVFEAPDRCILLLVAEHTRTANPYHLIYAALGIGEPEEPGPSHPAATTKDSRPSIPTSPNDSSAACEISAAD